QEVRISKSSTINKGYTFRIRRTPNPKITIHAKEEEKYCTVTLCDNGGGILLDDVEKIFEPYFSTKLDKTNTGLGLYMAKLIIESHNDGVLEVHHGEEGVCFTIKLPKSDYPREP
ncbi:MAG TPA: HAMP domain-containing histidine kinase, partial [Campylobacterales bacterium]|nr:HAMP domain-containing histidine kinase [Campylobacterales bacterium]